MGKKITDKVTWVGKVDWELTYFHGHEYSTFKGSSYNSYLIRDEKTVLIDTGLVTYDKEFVNNLKRETDLNKLTILYATTAKWIHSGALEELMREIPTHPFTVRQTGRKF